MKKEKLNILFLCTGNACRSQMAEGWAKKLKGDCIEAFSAGITPAGVSSRAAKVMAEAGVDISGQSSKHIDDLAGIDFDYVITLCDNAREGCPVFGGKIKLIHKPFADPTFLIGDEEVIMNAFRKTRDEIRDFILTLPNSLKQKKCKEKYD
jgi:arsenate reductase